MIYLIRLHWFFLALDAIDILCLVYQNFKFIQQISCWILNKLSIECQSEPKSRKKMHYDSFVTTLIMRKLGWIFENEYPKSKYTACLAVFVNKCFNNKLVCYIKFFITIIHKNESLLPIHHECLIEISEIYFIF